MKRALFRGSNSCNSYGSEISGAAFSRTKKVPQDLEQAKSQHWEETCGGIQRKAPPEQSSSAAQGLLEGSRGAWASSPKQRLTSISQS